MENFADSVNQDVQITLGMLLSADTSRPSGLLGSSTNNEMMFLMQTVYLFHGLFLA